jgi:hypothetical protein
MLRLSSYSVPTCVNAAMSNRPALWDDLYRYVALVSERYSSGP